MISDCYRTPHVHMLHFKLKQCLKWTQPLNAIHVRLDGGSTWPSAYCAWWGSVGFIRAWLPATLERLAAKCDMAAMRVGTSKSVAMVQCQKTGECSLIVLGGRLLRMRGFKNQESSWLNGKVEPELNRWIVSIIIIPPSVLFCWSFPRS